ncbi:MAG TPA: SDR family oxidoreductase [Streptosporangiaceae bacterium]|jgi:NAD(P)H dehydrogenase (quinone)|nr:SDR family oxidoreductase [Streptosporangiaceae bacterium]
MTIAVTGATGQFGRHAIESLLDRGVPADQIVAIGRDQAKLDQLLDLGVTVRRADYGDPASLRAAFAGVDRLLFVSGSEVGQRIPQHQAVVDAALEAGVGLVAYTSAPKADTSDMVLAEEHRVTERALIASGVPYVFLRNGWYIENYTDRLPVFLEHGLIGAAGDGLISVATRADLAEAAAAALTGDGHQGRVYELGGQSFTLAVLAAEIARQSGRDVRYTDLPEDAYAKALEDAGLPAPAPAMLADSDRAASQGALYVEGNDLEQLLGRPVTPWPEVVRAALAKLA